MASQIGNSLRAPFDCEWSQYNTKGSHDNERHDPHGTVAMQADPQKKA